MNCIIFGAVKNGWSGIVVLWEFKASIYFPAHIRVAVGLARRLFCVGEKKNK